ncbi:DUF1934 domain-containing protein [Paenibacillus apiarius]|uniref:DUF1934 domain-containing protein n=1 Tax=Paenibacillus apiarius TaxID=46240 RepID=UPI001981D9F8|nr:DUF1934 domain-containing protein [Paenibacillus apiarius]MBN3524428.1 DUF1934 domain-containing protein [Paenibacillus apiarius]
MTERQSEPANKRKVHIVIDSRQDDERVTQEVNGELYRKGEHFYVRYTEPVNHPDGKKDSDIGASSPTQVMIKISKRQIKLTRRGQVESEQTFSHREQRGGYYRSEALRFPMTTYTSLMEWNEPWPFDGPLQFDQLTLTWAYQLYIEEQCTGQFEIKLNVTPADTHNRMAQEE